VFSTDSEKGNSGTTAGRLSITATERDIRVASTWLATACSQGDIPEEPSYHLDLCLNELLANILAHGGTTARETPVVLSLAIDDREGRKEACLTLSDSGLPFDPSSPVPSRRTASLDEATIGGLGLSLIQSHADQLEYEYRHGRNHVRLRVHW
jgi:anti-sigma regulatory factor (Ser/Thr protein kinase)